MNLSKYSRVEIIESERPQYQYTKDCLIVTGYDYDIYLRPWTKYPLCWKEKKHLDEIEICYPFFENNVDIYDVFYHLIPIPLQSLISCFCSDFWWVLISLFKSIPQSVDYLHQNPGYLILIANDYYFSNNRLEFENQNILDFNNWDRILSDNGFPNRSWVLDLISTIPIKVITESLLNNLSNLLSNSNSIQFWENLRVFQIKFWQLVEIGMNEAFLIDVIHETKKDIILLSLISDDILSQYLKCNTHKERELIRKRNNIEEIGYSW